MSGGINAWGGNKALGPQELRMDMITGEESPAEMIALAYHMEASLGQFYKAAGNEATDADLIRLLNTLSEIEETHKQTLVSLNSELNPENPEPGALNSEFMEGGFDGATFLKANSAFLKKTTDVLDLAMMLETQSMDLYLRFADKSSHPGTQKVLFKIASEEKAHLKSLGRLYDEKI